MIVVGCLNASIDNKEVEGIGNMYIYVYIHNPN